MKLNINKYLMKNFAILFLLLVIVGTSNLKLRAQSPRKIFTVQRDSFIGPNNNPYKGNFILTEDFNNDGIKDQCLANFNSSSESTIYIFQGIATFPFYTEIQSFATLGYAGHYWNVMKFVDYDNDGKKDLCIRFNDGGYCTYQNSRIYWNTGNDNMPYDESTYYEFNQPGLCSYLSPIDMNSDNYLDLILEDALGSNDGVVYFNNQDRTFTQSSSTYSSGRDVSIKTLDINNDGKEDILGFDTGFNGDQITVNIQDNTSNFAEQLVYYNNGEKPNPGLILDNQHFIFNCSNDGSSSSNLIKGTWNGSGFGFTTFSNLLPIGNAYLVNSIDYNIDGKMDFLVASDTATNLRNYDIFYGENGFSFSSSNKKRVFTGVNYYIKECFFDQNEFRYTAATNDSLFVLSIGEVLSTTLLGTKLDQIELFPNPTSSSITIYSSEKMSKYKFRLYSIYGCRIDVRMESNTLDISQLNDGVYFLEVEYGNRRITKKIIKRSI